MARFSKRFVHHQILQSVDSRWSSTHQRRRHQLWTPRVSSRRQRLQRPGSCRALLCRLFASGHSHTSTTCTSHLSSVLVCFKMARSSSQHWARAKQLGEQFRNLRSRGTFSRRLTWYGTTFHLSPMKFAGKYIVSWQSTLGSLCQQQLQQWCTPFSHHGAPA